MNIPLDERTTVVCHGGVFNFDPFTARMQQILTKNGSESPVILTTEFSDNACLEGAALGALDKAA